MEVSLEAIIDILDSQRTPLNSYEREKRISGKSTDQLFPYYGATGQVGYVDDYIFDESLVLLGEDGVSFFDPLRHKAYRVEGKCWVNNHAHVLRAKSEVSDGRYIASYLNSFDYTGFVSGTTRLKLTQAAMRTIPVPLPPLNEQKRIADKLDALLARVDACRERLDRVPQVLKNFRQAVLAAATSGGLTEEWRGSQDLKSWEKMALSKICLSITDGDHQAPPQAEDGIPFITISAMNNGKLNLKKTTRFVPLSYYEQVKKNRRPEVGDILFSVTGSIAIPALVDIEESFTFQRHIAILKPDMTRIASKFLLYLLGTENIKEQALSVATGTAQLTIPLNGLRSFKIDLPPKNEQEEIVRRVETLFAFADRLEARYNAGRELIDQLIPSLLDKAFSGELTAEWREQNPDLISGENSADALLAQIKIQKIEADRANTNNRKSVKTKTGKNMKPKMIIPVAVALKAAGTPLAAQALLTQSGYSSDATTEDLERFFLVLLCHITHHPAVCMQSQWMLAFAGA